MMIDWQVDYYDPTAGLPMLTYESDGTISLKDLPSTGVVFIWFRQIVNGQKFTFRCAGWDWYFVKQDENGTRFGGWMDDGSRSPEFYWSEGSDTQTRKFIVGPPEDLEGCKVLEGIWVPEPDATELGL